MAFAPPFLPKQWRELGRGIHTSMLEEWNKRLIFSFMYTHTHPIIVTTWKNLGGIMLNEISESEKDKYRVMSLIPGI